MGDSTAASTRQIEYLPIDEIKGTEGNVKDHDLPAVILAMCRLGFTSPVVLDERTGRLVAGNGRTAALQALHAYRSGGVKAVTKLKLPALPESLWAEVDELLPAGTPPDGITAAADGWLVPVVRGWRSVDDDHARAAVIADNKLTEMGGWDDKGLTAWLDEIAGAAPDLLQVTGFDQDDLDDLLRQTDALAGRASGYFEDYIAGRTDDHTDAPGGPAAPPPAARAAAPAVFSDAAPETSGHPEAAGEAAAQPAPPAAEPPADTPKVTYVNVSWTVPTPDRDTIRRALQHAQTTWGLDTSGAALVALAARYLADNT